jgi:transcriptional regulator with XRE-family HTH domain
MTATDLGRVIRRLRQSQHRTTEELARAAGVHPSYLSRIERGVRDPSLTVLHGLADALGVPLSAIMQEVEGETQ